MQAYFKTDNIFVNLTFLTTKMQNYQQLLMQYKDNILPKHHPATMAIERVGGRIFKAAGEFATEYNLGYFDKKNVTFTVVDTDQANAFVLPGNHVFCK
jgi:predicted Zn-dependent protease